MESSTHTHTHTHTPNFHDVSFLLISMSMLGDNIINGNLPFIHSPHTLFDKAKAIDLTFHCLFLLLFRSIPIEMYTVMFAIARSVGWVAQWKELMSERTIKITRPRQIYVGEQRRDFVPVARRERSSAAKQSDGDVYSESAVGNSCSLSVMHRSVSTHVRNAMG